VVWGGKLLVKGVSTDGLAPGSRVNLRRMFLVDGTKTYMTRSGREVLVPCLVAIDLKKIDSVLDGEEVKKWVRAKLEYQEAKARAERAEAEAARRRP
jgi:hypothetical protein